MTIKFAQRLFLVAGIYGVAVVAPLLFLEKRLGEADPPPITHPEWYYGFVWVTLAWQIVYLIMWRDPLRFRPMLIPAMLGKAGFAISVFVLVAQQRMAAANAWLPAIDLVLVGLFLWAFISLRVQTWSHAD
jgi:cytochrome c oxidase subunit IV